MTELPPYAESVQRALGEIDAKISILAARITDLERDRDQLYEIQSHLHQTTTNICRVFANLANSVETRN